jgi:predicted translin family RNA/ssDNA-binding protein|tara:strand:+ start:3617 stop:3853 length:237 start_codon:yes stop_codon:yes gene_type:complete
MATQSQQNREAIIELDKKVALLSQEVLIMRDNQMENLSIEVQELKKSVNQLYKLAVGFAIMLSVIFADTVQSMFGLIF